jgi:hypothetical protein
MFGQKFFLSYQSSLSQFIRATPLVIGPKNEWFADKGIVISISSTINDYLKRRIKQKLKIVAFLQGSVIYIPYANIRGFVLDICVFTKLKYKIKF